MALSLGGVSDKLIQTAPASTFPLTMAAWINVTTIVGNHYVMSMVSTTPNSNVFMGLRQTAAAATAISSNVSGVVATSASSITTGTWFHVAAVFTSATSRKVWLNGVSTSNATSNSPTGLDTFILGAVFSGTVYNSFLSGSIAYPAAWSIDLSATDIASLYNSGAGSDPRTVQNGSLISFSFLQSGPPYLDSVTTLNWTVTGSPSVVADPFSITSGLTLTGSLGVSGIFAPSLGIQTTGSIQVTGATNLPAAIPQLTGSWGITGQLKPALSLQVSGSILETGLVSPSVALPGLSGSIRVTGSTNLPAVIVRLTGSITGTGLFKPVVAVPLRGSILVTGVTSLGPPPYRGSILLPGQFVRGIGVPFAADLWVTGVVNTGASLVPSPWIMVPGLSIPRAGAIIADGAGLFQPGLAGNLGLIGTTILVFQPLDTSVTVSVSGIYITLTVDNSYWITFLLAGVDYQTWIRAVLSGPYVKIGRTMAYDVAVQELYSEIGSSS